MSPTRAALASVVALLAAACSQDQDRPDADTFDGSGDVAADADPDVPTDVPADTPADVPADLPVDVPADVPADTPTDTPADLPDGIVAVGCSVAGEETHAAPGEQAVIIPASLDGLELHGTLLVPAAGGPPRAAVVLLHRMCADRSEWRPAGNDLALDLARRGFVVLVYDQRGFGASTAGGTLNLCRNPTPPELAKTVGDLEDVLDWLAARPEVDPDCLGTGGSSIGANTAVLEGAPDPRVDTTLALSPGLDYFGLRPLPAVAPFGPRPLLAVAASGDTESATAVEAFGAAGSHVTERIPAGSAHGMPLLVAEPDLYAEVLDWFSDRL